MGVGSKIKELRTKSGLTQKELADELHVTYQAVSRWENESAEPSIDVLKALCGILNCSINELLEMEKEETPKEEKIQKEEKVQIVERVIVQESKPVLGVCEECNKPIYESNDLNRVEETYRVSHGKLKQRMTRQRVLCNDCNTLRLMIQKKMLEKEEKERVAKLRKRRIKSFVFPGIVLTLALALAITFYASGEYDAGNDLIIFGVFSYTFIATLILNNTFVTDMWLKIASWGFVSLPGVIFEFSLDGLVFLILVKVFFFIFGMLLALFTVVFATIVCSVMSVFAYPFALRRNIKGIK